MQKKIQKLINSSKKIIENCTYSNGAIIAACQTEKNLFEGAKDYRFVWPRDAAFTCIVSKELGINQEKFFEWLMTAQGWNNSGLFYKSYYLDGYKREKDLQLDQSGSVLFALHDFCSGDKIKIKKFEKLIVKSADALSNLWKKDHFTLINQELWEKRRSFPDMKENFSYTLAACYKGLLCANEMIPNKTWKRVALEIKKTLISKSGEYFPRSIGKFGDLRIDSSVLGLAWPFKIVDTNDPKMVESVKLIEKNLVKDLGVYRFEGDEYDGWMQGKYHRKKGAGYWPLLNFWLSIYFVEAGNKSKARKYYMKAVEDISGNKIPEQIFENKVQKGITPLCWAHCLFIIASKKLGHMK